MSKKEEERPEEEEEEEEDDIEGLLADQNDNGGTDEQELAKERMTLLLKNFDDDQMNRYEAFRRANINRNNVKKFANAVLNQSITANVSVALSGMSKVMVGEVVERARDVQEKMDAIRGTQSEALRPEHLREAWRQYKLETDSVPGARFRRLGQKNGMFR